MEQIRVLGKKIIGQKTGVKNSSRKMDRKCLSSRRSNFKSENWGKKWRFKFSKLENCKIKIGKLT